MKDFKKVIEDIFYVSKLTGTRNKKVLIFASVVLSQLSAVTDVSLIAIFAAIIANQFTNIEFINQILNFLLENRLVIIVFVIFRFVFQYNQSMILRKIEENVDMNLKVYLLKEIFEKRNYSVADSYFYINVLSGHIAFFYSSFASFLNSFLQIFAYSIYLFISDPSSVSIFMGGAIILILPIRKLLVLAREYMHISYEKGKESNVEIQRVVENLFLIKILKKDEDELKSFSQTLNNFRESMLKNHSVGLINGYLPSFVTLMVLTLVLTFSSYAKSITLDFIGVTLRLFQSFGTLTNSVNRLVNSQVHIEKFQQIEENKIKQNTENYKISEGSSIKIEDLSFKYFNSNSYIFENINLNLKKNTHTVIVGENGSGKSTLLGLLAGVFYSDKGSITSFSDKFSYIGATPLIFDSTLRENLLYGNKKDIEDSEIIYFLELLDTFKETSGYKLENKISNKTLSSGQMQKIAFIRALLADTDILLLDEATSNLDDLSKNKIFSLLKEKNITIINSTHDPDSFENVDKKLKIHVKDEKRTIELS